MKRAVPDLHHIVGERHLRQALAGFKGIAANILGASTKSIEGMAYGNMLLGISGDEKTVQEAISYLSEISNVITEEVDQDAR